MDVGLAIFLTGDGIHPAVLARAAEERGYESLFVTEHTHIPVSAGMVARAGGAAGRQVPPHARPVRRAGVRGRGDRAAGRSARRVCLVIEHDPIVLAKQVASLDVLSGGRFVFGVGAGWNKQEMRNHGTDPATRHGNMRERVEAMKAIWTSDEAEYHGKHVDFDPIWQWPKPLQTPLAGLHRRQRPARAGPRAALRRRLDAEHEGARDARRRGSPSCASAPGAHVPVTYYGATPENLDAAARRRAWTAR